MGADFTDAFKTALSAKCKIDKANVKIDATKIVSTSANAAKGTPSRTEFPLEITVPAELTVEALKSRLIEDGDWKKKIRQALVDSGIAFTSLNVHSGDITTKTDAVLVSEVDVHDPLITLDMDIKGVYYSQLSAGSELRSKFAQAIQAGIATQGLEASSIGLDVSNGGPGTGVPFVHVVAKIPVPAGLSADATMSLWPESGSQIRTQIQEKLRAISGIDQVTKSGKSGPHPITVFADTLHLGAVRQMYATHVKVGVSVHYLRYTPAAGQVHVEPTAIETQVKDALVKMAGVDKDDVEKVGNAVTPNADEIRWVFSVAARGAEAAALKTADWEAKLLPAGRKVQRFFEATYPGAINDADPNEEYMVSVGIGDVSSEVDTIDLDLVVHGIDYDEISDKSKKSFLTKLAEAIRQGVKDGAANGYVNTNVAKIRVVVSPHDTDDPLNVRAQIPAPALEADQLSVMKALDDKLAKSPGGIQDTVETRIEAIAGIDFLSTWTTEAIYVSVPGKMDDYAGDVVAETDRT